MILTFFLSPAICVGQNNTDFDDGEIDWDTSQQTSSKKERKPQSSTEVVTDHIVKEEINLSDFSSFKLHYMADFDNLGKGSYGFGSHFLGIGGSPFGFTYGLYYNAGIVDAKYSTFAFNVGPNVGLNLGRYVAFFVPVLGYFGWTGIGGGDTIFGWSLGGQPTLALRLGRVILYAGVPISYSFKAEKVSTALEVALGFNF